MANDSGLFGLGSLGGAFGGKKKMQAIIDALAKSGRDGDTMVAHINPQEAALLDRVTDGGSINPKTGMLEFADDSGQVSNATGASGSNWGGGGYSSGGYGGSSGYSGGYTSNGGVFGPGETFTDPLTGGSYQANSGGSVSYVGGGAGHDAYVGTAGAGYAPSDYNTRYAYQPSGHIGNTSWGYNSDTNPIRRQPVAVPNELTVPAPVPPANIPPQHPISTTPTTAYGQPQEQGIPGETIDYQSPMDVFSAFNQWAPTVDWSNPNTYASSGNNQVASKPARSKTAKADLGFDSYPGSWNDPNLGFNSQYNGNWDSSIPSQYAAYGPDFSSYAGTYANLNNELSGMDFSDPSMYAQSGNGPLSVTVNPRKGGLWGKPQSLPNGSDMYNSGPGSDWYSGPNGETIGVNRYTGQVGTVGDPQNVGQSNYNSTRWGR